MSKIDMVLQEVSAYDYKWFEEIGGPQARAEVSALRFDLEAANDHLHTEEEDNQRLREAIWKSIQQLEMFATLHIENANLVDGYRCRDLANELRTALLKEEK